MNFETNLLSVQNELLNYAYKLTSNNTEVAKDLVQETLVKACLNYASYTEDSNFKNWMYTIMYHIFLNTIRDQKRKRTIIDYTDELGLLNQGCLDTASVDENYDLKEIRQIVNSLPKDIRMIYMMHLSGFRQKEISEKLGISLSVVKRDCSKASKYLQSQLKEFVTYR